MSFEYHLTPAEGGAFTPSFLQEAREWLGQRCTLTLTSVDGFLVFEDDAARARYRPPAFGRNDYLTASVVVEPWAIVVSSANDEGTDQVLYDFVIWASGRVPAELWYGRQRAEASDLLERA